MMKRRSRNVAWTGLLGGVLGTLAIVGVRTSQGMLIMRVGKTDVLNVDPFRQAMAGESFEKGILLLVATPTENRFVVLTE